MPPYAGEGVNMAMLDALELSKLLLSERSSSEAIERYEVQMFGRMRHITADARANTEMFYAPDAADRVAAMFRSFARHETVQPAPGGLSWSNNRHVGRLSTWLGPYKSASRQHSAGVYGTPVRRPYTAMRHSIVLVFR